jgi:hypothetical protein
MLLSRHLRVNPQDVGGGYPQILGIARRKTRRNTARRAAVIALPKNAAGF